MKIHNTMKNLTTLLLGIVFATTLNAQSIVDASDIIDKINNGEAVVYENTIIEGDLDFTQVENKTLQDVDFSKFKVSEIEDIYDRTSDNYYVEIDSKIEFINCEFTGKVTGYSVDEEENQMYNVRFNKNVTFASCTFEEEIQFKYAVFNEDTEMESSYVDGGSNFTYAQFNNIVDFSRTSFLLESNFNNAVFTNLAMFQSTEFFGKAIFGEAIFKDAVYFTNTNFADKAMFTFASFKRAIFNHSRFNKEGYFSYATFSKFAEFENAIFTKKADFNNTRFYEKVNLNGAKFKLLPKFKFALVNNLDIFTYILSN